VLGQSDTSYSTWVGSAILVLENLLQNSEPIAATNISC